MEQIPTRTKKRESSFLTFLPFFDLRGSCSSSYQSLVRLGTSYSSSIPEGSQTVLKRFYVTWSKKSIILTSYLRRMERKNRRIFTSH